MPLYDMRCDTCDTFDEVFCRYENRNDQACHSCGTLMYIVYKKPLRVVGILPSRPLTLRKQELEFTSNAELRRYQKENPNTVFVDTSDSAWRKHKDSARENAERVAKKAGYRDLDERRSIRKRENKRRQELGAK